MADAILSRALGPCTHFPANAFVVSASLINELDYVVTGFSVAVHKNGEQ